MQAADRRCLPLSPLHLQYGVYLLAAIALRVWWLTVAHDTFDIVILAIGLAVVVSRVDTTHSSRTAASFGLS